MKKNQLIIIFVFIFVSGLITMSLNMFSTVNNSDAGMKRWTQLLATACQLISLKEGHFPIDKDELLRLADIQPTDGYVESISYSLNPDEKNGTLTANMLFDRKYSMLCTGEELIK